MANNWPSIQNPSRPFDEDVFLPQVRTEFEGNYVQTRPKVSRAKKKWALYWKGMREEDYQTLIKFFRLNQGTSFTWTHPVSGTSYTCVFSGDNLRSRIINVNRREVWCAIEEL